MECDCLKRNRIELFCNQTLGFFLSVCKEMECNVSLIIKSQINNILIHCSLIFLCSCVVRIATVVSIKKNIAVNSPMKFQSIPGNMHNDLFCSIKNQTIDSFQEFTREIERRKIIMFVFVYIVNAK